MRTLTHQQQSIKLNKFVAGRFFREFFSLSFSLHLVAVSFARTLAVRIHIYNRVKRVTELPRTSIAFFRIRFHPCIRLHFLRIHR